MKYYFATLATLVVLLMGVGSLFGQEDSPAPGQAVTESAAEHSAEAGVAYMGYVVFDPEREGWAFLRDEEAHAKLDAIAAHLGLVVGEDTRPNLNTIDEQELFGIMSVAKIYGARSKAALIWSHIHNEGHVIGAKGDLLAIAGIGDVTVDALWPLVQVGGD